MEKALKRLKKDKLFDRFLIPALFSILLIICYFMFKLSEEIFMVWLDFIGLLLITMGAVFGLRPILRSLINPRMRNSKNIDRRNTNAGVISFSLLMGGFTMQLTSKFYLLFPESFLPDWNFVWPLIFFIVIIINYCLLFRILRKIKYG